MEQRTYLHLFNAIVTAAIAATNTQPSWHDPIAPISPHYHYSGSSFADSQTIRYAPVTVGYAACFAHVVQ